MCGIAGSVAFGTDRPDRDFPANACHAMSHRGPDEQGFHVDETAALGMCRLRVIGLADGAQPVSSPDGRIICVLNGEIYNHRELRQFLRSRGHEILGGSDASVLPLLYQELGDGFAKALHGMFAIAVHDTRTGRLVLVTDRVGKKPLFYTRTTDGVAFASELRALMQYPGIDRTVDPAAVDQYLDYRVVPAPHTIYRAVRKVTPGTIVTCTADQPLSVRRYWNFDFTADLNDLDDDQVTDRIDELLRQAVADRLESEVPLGAMLSGGLDSSLVTALARRALPGDLHTFSVGFEHPDFDESHHARAVAEYCGTIHHSYRITADDALAAIDEVLLHMGEPYAFPSAIAAYYMYKLAAQHVTVVLTGDGSDEIFCGYRRYQRFGGLAGDLALPDRYASVLADGLTGEIKQRLYRGPGGRNPLAERFAGTRHDVPDLDRAMQVDCGFWLPDAQLVKIDRMAMAHSVEPRSPLLDHRLIDFVTRIPAARKLVDGVEKVPLRRVAERYLNHHVLDRAKQELAVPLESWLGGALRPAIQSTLLSEAALQRGYFDADTLRSMVTQYRPADSYALWTLYMLERWHQLAIDDAPAVEGSPSR